MNIYRYHIVHIILFVTMRLVWCLLENEPLKVKIKIVQPRPQHYPAMVFLVRALSSSIFSLTYGFIAILDSACFWQHQLLEHNHHVRWQPPRLH